MMTRQRQQGSDGNVQHDPGRSEQPFNSMTELAGASTCVRKTKRWRTGGALPHLVARAAVVAGALVMLVAPAVGEPGKEAGTAASWPQFGGPDRNFTVAPAVATSWAASGPAERWRREIGPGFAGMVVDGDRLITLYRDGEDDVIAAFDRDDGKILWEYRYTAPVTPSYSLDTSYGEGPNSTPLLADGRVTTLGFSGTVTQVDAATGERRWSHDLRKEYGQLIPYFGHASSPVRHGDMVIVVAGDLYAFDHQTGELRWRHEEAAGSYASPVLIPRGERTLLLVAGAGEVVGLDADTGTLLWRQEYANQYKTILSSPVFGDDNWVFVSAYFLGSIGLELSKDGDAAEKRWEIPNVQLSHTNAVRVGDRVLGFHNSILTAVNIKTGAIEWRHRGLRRGNLLRTGDRFLLLDHLGKVSVFSAGADGVDVQAEAQVLTERAWTAPVLLDQTLYVRTEETLVAYDLSRAAGGAGSKTQTAGYVPSGTPPEGFAEAFKTLHAAIYAGDDETLAGVSGRFAAWTDGEWTPVAHYCIAVASWQRVGRADGSARLALLNDAVGHLDKAVALRADYADAHALLARIYPLYRRLDPQRAAVIGPLSSEHLALAEVHAPANPRVVAARGMSLFYQPAEYGGDQALGLEKLRQALVLFEKAPAGNEQEESIGPTAWGEALIWSWYGGALLRLPEPDRDEARRAFEKAVALEPGFTRARTSLTELEGDANASDG